MIPNARSRFGYFHRTIVSQTMKIKKLLVEAKQHEANNNLIQAEKNYIELTKQAPKEKEYYDKVIELKMKRGIYSFGPEMKGLMELYQNNFKSK